MVSFTLQLLYSRDNASSTRWTWGWMVPRPVLDILGKKNLLPMFGIEPWFCVIWPIVNQFTERIITSIICVSTVALVLSWKQLLLHVEHSDLQGTYNEEIHVSEILDMVCDARSDENNSEQKRKLPLCVIMQRVVVVSYRCFRTTIGPIIRVQKSLKLWGWNIVCPEMPVRNYYCSLHNNTEEHSSQLLWGRGLKSRTSKKLLQSDGCETRFQVVTSAAVE